MNIPDPNKPPTLMQMLATLNSGNEDDIAFIAAAAHNLYNEANRRLRGKVLLSPMDVKALSQILDILLTDRYDGPEAFEPAKSRPFKLTDEESDHLLKAISNKTEPAKP